MTNLATSYVLILDTKTQRYVGTYPMTKSAFMESLSQKARNLDSNLSIVELDAVDYWSVYLDPDNWTLSYDSAQNKYLLTLVWQGAMVTWFETSHLSFGWDIHFRVWLENYLSLQGMMNTLDESLVYLKRRFLNKFLVGQSFTTPELQRYPTDCF